MECREDNVTARAPHAGRGRWAGWLISFGPAILWMAVIFGLSSRRSLPTGGIDAVSILGHFTVYAMLAALLKWGLRREGLPMRRALVLAFALATLYGVTDEVHQSFVPGRDPDPLDLIVDAIGAGTALTLIVLRH
ncbi:MAG: hypothetical protein C4346_15635 [Chloroflexota bacterium]